MSLIQALRWCTDSWRRSLPRLIGSGAKRTSGSQERCWEMDAAQTASCHRVDLRDRPKAPAVDDRAWAELEMDKVFARLDRSVTPLGAQSLYALLRQYSAPGEPLEANRRICGAFTSNPAAGQRLRTALQTLSVNGCGDLVDFLVSAPTAPPAGYRWFYAASALAFVCPLGLIFSPWFLFVCLGFWLTNIALHSIYSRELLLHTPALASLARLLNCVPKIVSAVADLPLPETSDLKSAAPVAKELTSKISRMFLRAHEGDDLTRAVIEYLNLLCLFELSSTCRALVEVNRRRATLISLARLIGRLDAFQGLALALPEFPILCAPEFKAGRCFLLADLYHPLIEHPVPTTTIAGHGQSLLLSGTNMSGKTTFMKAVGISVILAQTLGLCFARTAVLPAVRIKTLIGREDKVTSGQSYFLFEASELLRMWHEVEKADGTAWFLIDEIFRGTNTLERVAAGSAVLRHLTGRALVFASTHDHELIEQLREQFEPYHFSEILDGAGMRFDYQLRPGPCLSRNAIKWLVLAGYPKEVTDLATRLARG